MVFRLSVFPIQIRLPTGSADDIHHYVLAVLRGADGVAPSRHSRGYDDLAIPSLIFPIVHRPSQFGHKAYRPDLPRMGMAAKHQVYPLGGILLRLHRLMIHHDDEFVPAHPL